MEFNELKFVGYSVKVEIDGLMAGLSFEGNRTMSRTLRIDDETGELYVIIENCRVRVVQKFSNDPVHDIFVESNHNGEEYDDERCLERLKDWNSNWRKPKKRRYNRKGQVVIVDNSNVPKQQLSQSNKEWLDEFDKQLDDLINWRKE